VAMHEHVYVIGYTSDGFPVVPVSRSLPLLLTLEIHASFVAMRGDKLAVNLPVIKKRRAGNGSS
jgi:hypothetical protein